MENKTCAIIFLMKVGFYLLFFFSLNLLSFPEKANMKNHTLLLNGVGLKEVTIFNIDVYKAALYLPKKTSDLNEINKLFPKVIDINFLREISFDDLRKTLEKGLKRYNIYTKENVLAIEKWKDVITEINHGTKLKIIFTEKSLILEAKEKRNIINNPTLSKGFHLLWVGTKSDPKLRSGMLNIK